MKAHRPTTRPAPVGYRWATGGGSPIGDCNGYHLARHPGPRGTICGRYGPATPPDPPLTVVMCRTCARIAKVADADALADQARRALRPGYRVAYSDLSPWEDATVCATAPTQQQVADGVDLLLLFADGPCAVSRFCGLAPAAPQQHDTFSAPELGDHGQVYRAECSCGWVSGRAWARQARADADGRAHTRGLGS